MIPLIPAELRYDFHRNSAEPKIIGDDWSGGWTEVNSWLRLELKRLAAAANGGGSHLYSAVGNIQFLLQRLDSISCLLLSVGGPRVDSLQLLWSSSASLEAGIPQLKE